MMFFCSHDQCQSVPVGVSIDDLALHFAAMHARPGHNDFTALGRWFFESVTLGTTTRAPSTLQGARFSHAIVDEIVGL